METKFSKILSTFYGPNKYKGDLIEKPMPNHSRMVNSIARCPWHKEITASLLADHSKGNFHCLSCGAKGSLVDGAKKGFLALQNENV